MRKFVLIALLTLLVILCAIVIGVGIKIGPIKIYSYPEVLAASKERKELLEVNDENIKEIETTQTSLKSAAKKYENKKAEYDELIEKGKITTESNIYNSNVYDMDFLWATIGNYATQNAVLLDFNFWKSAQATSVSSEYIICKLDFTVTGDYIPITNFISQIEADDTLKFEISNFNLEKGGENLQATFSVKNVPINSKNLSAIPTTSTSTLPEEN